MLFSHNVSSASSSRFRRAMRGRLLHSAGGSPVAVARRDFLDVRDAALADHIGGKKIGELAHTVGLAARREQELAKGQVGDGLRQAKTQLRSQRIGAFERMLGGERLQLVVAVDDAAAEVGGSGIVVFVVEKLHRAAQESALVVE